MAKQPTTSTDLASDTSTGVVTPPMADAGDTAAATSRTSEAKTRFSAALDEAKAGASALGDEARTRAGQYRDDAKARSEDWAVEAKVKGRELADTGKTKASEGLTALSRVIDENASTLDEKLGAKYGDYARNASRSLQENAQRLNDRSIDELADDGREAIRKSPVAAVGIAAVVGFFFARLFR